MRYWTFPIIVFVLLLVLPITASNNDEKISIDATIKGGDLLSLNATGYIESSSSGPNFDNVLIGDGKVSTIWEDVSELEVASYGDHGSISSMYDDAFIYFKITHDPSMEWISMQIDGDNSSDPNSFNDADLDPMAKGDDMWIFGHATETLALGDASAAGQELPFVNQDQQNDLLWERIPINDTDGNLEMYTWEVKRALNTSDADGFDAVFSPGYDLSILLASDVYHRPDNSVVYVKLILSDAKIGGEEPIVISEEPVVEEPVQVKPYLFKHVAYAIFIGTMVFTTSNITSTILMKRSANNQ